MSNTNDIPLQIKNNNLPIVHLNLPNIQPLHSTTQNEPHSTPQSAPQSEPQSSQKQLLKNYIYPPEEISEDYKDQDLKEEYLQIYLNKCNEKYMIYNKNLSDLNNKCWERKLLHTICYKYYNRRSITIGILTIIITAISSIISYLLNDNSYESSHTQFKLVLMILTTLSTLLQSILKGLEWDAKSESHNNASESYKQILTDISLFYKQIESEKIKIDNKIEINFNSYNDGTNNSFKTEFEKAITNFQSLYEKKIKEFSKSFSNTSKRCRYVIPSSAETQKDQVKLNKFISMERLDREVDYIKMRSENLKHLINLEKYKQGSKIHYPYPTISIVNLKELLDYKKVSLWNKISHFFLHCCCFCCFSEKVKNDKKNIKEHEIKTYHNELININNNNNINNINDIENSNNGENNGENNEENNYLNNKWKTNYQLEKDWIYKTTNIIERVNNIQDINKIYKQNKRDNKNNIV